MITTYGFKIRYRKKYDNKFKMHKIRDFDSKLGKEVIIDAKGKPYISKRVHESYFLSKENALRSMERLLASDTIKYVKMYEGEFKVEEVNI